ncbi:hydroxyacid-oxoacid transhydrogenase [Streptomyces sp. NBC_01197]|uniref:hydroxyacid-oxoacid transhydrogenase n=1 Tax=Streptomyces sp. NBC_01197 TaxID=2903768 RepID=UPI002E0FC58F|nr:iron-containing alcohol dehydrogenase [Streptomyces sp. NBC_01197]
MPSFDNPTESVFTWAAPPLKFGLGAIAEIGEDLQALGVTNALIITDPGVAATGVPDRVAHAVKAAGLDVRIFDGVAVEPTDVSIGEAVEFARSGPWDGYIAVGGGSAMDTAKAVNLLTTQPGTLMDYIAPPIGGGKVPTLPVKPLIAVPTTAGTGSEATTICVVDLLDLRLKAGISHPRLRPALAVVDPLTSMTVPAAVTAASGMDVLTHAAESYTALSFDARPAFPSAKARAAFCGANPISDVWCEKAMELVGVHLRRAVMNGNDLSARYGMAYASAVTGMGFGNAGTHIPHANAYPIAGAVENYRAQGYPEMPMVPHGQAVASTAMAAFRFTYPSNPQRHLRAAELIGGRPVDPDEGTEALPRVLRELLRDIGMPNGITAFGYSEDRLGELVSGTMKQSRQLSVVPRPLTTEAAEQIFRESLRNW